MKGMYADDRRKVQALLDWGIGQGCVRLPVRTTDQTKQVLSQHQQIRQEVQTSNRNEG